MIPCFVISLPDCTDRRDRISTSLYELEIGFEFVDAIDGRNGLDIASEHEIDRIAAKEAGHLLSDAEFACALSHIKIYRKIVAEKIPFALVLEDDAIPYPQLYDFLKGEYYRGTDLTQIFCADSRIRVQRKGKIELFGSYVSYLCPQHFPCPGAVGYVISYEGAQHFVQCAVPISNVADWPDCVEVLIAKQKSRVVHPSLIWHNMDVECSLLSRHGRNSNKEKRRVFGVYLPPFRKIVKSFVRAPLKLSHQRLPSPRQRESLPLRCSLK